MIIKIFLLIATGFAVPKGPLKSGPPNFHCWVTPLHPGIPGMLGYVPPVHAVEYSSLCSFPGSRTNAAPGEDDAAKQVLCFYDAMCAPGSDEILKNPGVFDLTNEYTKAIPGVLPSQIVCTRTADIKNRRFVRSPCGIMNADNFKGCVNQKILYNYIDVDVTTPNYNIPTEVKEPESTR